VWIVAQPQPDYSIAAHRYFLMEKSRILRVYKEWLKELITKHQSPVYLGLAQIMQRFFFSVYILI